ncbi:MAG: HEAT repeat domain-containing protein [Planctomycetes bacterium]|nr:HEAT repeat domain-containing protein [Planctomycetota bacterium]
MNEVPEGSAARRPKRHWLQFSLRMMFVVITVCALLLGLVMWRIRQREQAVDAIQRLGGNVILGDETPTPQWLKRLVFPKVVVVDLAGTKATNADLARLKGFLKPLETLKLDHTKITTGGLEHLAGLSALETLSLAGTGASDADLAHLKPLGALVQLDLSGTRVTDAGLQHLAALARLEVLNLSDTQVTDVGLQHLRGLIALKRLHLEATQISAASVGHLENLTRLQTVTVHVPDGGGRQARDLLASLPGAASVGLLRSGVPPIWDSSQPWETSPAGVAETILSQVDLNPEETVVLAQALAETRNRNKWGRVLSVGREPSPAPSEEDRIESVEEFVQAVKDAGPDNSNFPRRWLYAKSDAAKQAIPSLLELLEDPDYAVRSRSAFLLVRIGLDNEQVAAAIARLLKDNDPRMRAITAYTFDGTRAVYMYGEIGPRIGPEDAKVAIPMLLALSRDEYREARSASVDGLGSIVQANPQEAKAVVPVLLEMLQDRDVSVRRGAAWALGRIAQVNPEEARTAIPVLFELLRNGGATGKETTVRAAGLVLRHVPERAGEAVPMLLEMLRGKNTRVAKASAEALGQIVEGSPEEVKTITPVILKMLEHGDELTRQTGKEALSKVADAIIAPTVKGPTID